MDGVTLDKFRDLLETLLSYLLAIDIQFQLIGIAVGALLTLLLHRLLIHYTSHLENLVSDNTFLVIWYKSFQRILFPLILFLLIRAIYVIFTGLKLKTELLNLISPLIFSLVIIRLSVYLLRKAFRPGPALKTFENGITGTIWLIVVLYMVGWLGGVVNFLDNIDFKLGEAQFSVLSIIKFIFSATFFLLLAGYLARLIEKKLIQLHTVPANLKLAITRSVKLFLIIIAFLVALNSVGFDLTIFTVIGGALGVGIGFGLQRIASNYISGFILIMDRSIKPGDIISTGESFGWVNAIRGRYIVVKDRDGVETLIPNETLVTSQVINWSYGDKQVRIKIPLQVSYSDNPRRCIEIMLESAFAHKRVLKTPEPTCMLKEFGDNGITLELFVWISDPENGFGEVRTAIYLEIWDRFKAEGVTIPFPQRDVHLYPSE